MKKTQRCFQAASLVGSLLHETGDAVIFFRDDRGDHISVSAGLAVAPHWTDDLMKIAPSHKKEIKEIKETLVAVTKSYKNKKLVAERLKGVHKKLVTLKQKLGKSCE